MNTRYNAADIEVLSGLDPVKRRPGMYTDTTRPNHLAQEVIDNSVDEALAGHARRDRGDMLRRRQLRSVRRRPRHAGGHPSRGEDPRHRTDPDPPARRRQVQQQELHLLRRPARRRRQRGQRAVASMSKCSSSATARNTAWSSATATAARRWKSSAASARSNTGTRLRFWPDPKYFDTPKIQRCARCATCCAPRPCCARA